MTNVIHPSPLAVTHGAASGRVTTDEALIPDFRDLTSTVTRSPAVSGGRFSTALEASLMCVCEEGSEVEVTSSGASRRPKVPPNKSRPPVLCRAL